MSLETYIPTEQLMANISDYTAVDDTASEESLLAAGGTRLPYFKANYFQRERTSFTLRLRGVFSTTGTPTLTFQARVGATGGSGTLSGSSVGVSAAITTINNSANAGWELFLHGICLSPGGGATSASISFAGWVKSPAGFAAPYEYNLVPSQGALGTYTVSLDNSVQLYLNASVTWSAASASNTITCKQLQLIGWH